MQEDEAGTVAAAEWLHAVMARSRVITRRLPP
jgi:hypothetical protein